MATTRGAPTPVGGAPGGARRRRGGMAPAAARFPVQKKKQERGLRDGKEEGKETEEKGRGAAELLVWWCSDEDGGDGVAAGEGARGRWIEHSGLGRWLLWAAWRLGIGARVRELLLHGGARARADRALLARGCVA